MYFTLPIAIVTCLSAVVAGRTIEDVKMDPKQISQVASTLLAQAISHGFINRIQKHGASQLSQNPKIPLLPNLPDPICIDANEIELNIPGILIGRLALVNEGEIFGLSRFKDDLRITTNENLLNVAWEMRLPIGGFTGDYEYEFTEILDTPTNYVGAGLIFSYLQGVFFRFDAKGIFALNETMSLDYLDVDMGCENVTVHPDFGQDPPVDIGPWIKGLFEAFIWNGLTRPLITELVRCMIHTVVKGCTVADLVHNNPACLDFDIMPCLTVPVPTAANSHLVSTWLLLPEIQLGMRSFNYHPYACPRSEPTEASTPEITTGGSSTTSEVTTGASTASSDVTTESSTATTDGSTTTTEVTTRDSTSSSEVTTEASSTTSEVITEASSTTSEKTAGASNANRISIALFSILLLSSFIKF